jgi:hypothetical protein
MHQSIKGSSMRSQDLFNDEDQNHTVNDVIVGVELSIISIANTSVWIERIWNACTNTHTYIKMDDPYFLFPLSLFFLPLSLSLSFASLGPEGFDWQTNTHTHTHSREKNERRLLWLYLAREMHVSLVWQLSVYLVFYLIYSRWIFYTICQERQRERSLRIVALAWKMLLIDVM